MKLLLACLLPIMLSASSVNAQSPLPLDELAPGATVLLTQDSHDSWPAWSPDGREVAFVSARSGSPNLYTIRLDSVRALPSQQEGVFAASYLTAEGEADPAVAVTHEDERIVDSPTWLPEGGGLLVRSYACESYSCTDFRIDRIRGGELRPVLNSEVRFVAPGEGERLLVVFEDDGTSVASVDPTTSERSTVYTSEDEVRGMSRRGSELLVAHSDRIVAVDADGNARDLVTDIRFNGTRVERDGDAIYLTAVAGGGPAAASLDIQTGEVTPLLSSYDYEPVLSPDGKWVAFISEGASGLILQRLR